MSDAQDSGQLVRVQCQLCRITRHYLPADMVLLVGNVGIDTVETRMRCDNCGRHDYVRAVLWHPQPRSARR